VTGSARRWLRYAIDYSSPVAFLGSYFLGGRDFMFATGVSIAVGVVAIALGLIVERRLGHEDLGDLVAHLFRRLGEAFLEALEPAAFGFGHGAGF
jgi:intracellular septation protein A